MNEITGKVWNFGANIDTDIIIAARYLNSSDPEHLAKYIMEDADPDFPSKIQRGDIIVAGENFGCGSSREHAPIALKAKTLSNPKPRIISTSLGSVDNFRVFKRL